MAKSNIHKKNTFGKYADDYLGKKLLVKKASRKFRRDGKKVCRLLYS